MNSIRFRLIVLFIVVTTTTLAAFGIYAQFLLSRELELRFVQLQNETVSRLAISAPRTIWDLDPAGARSVLHAEMLPVEVRGIQILDPAGHVFASAMRDDKGNIQEEAPAGLDNGPRAEAELYYRVAGVDPTEAAGKGTLMGRAVVYFSRARMEATLRADAWRRVVEIVVIDLILLVALTLSLRMVFRPLSQLRDALFDLSRHEGTDAEELPETQRNEFGEVVQGFNLTQRKLKQVMDRRQQAEEASRAAVVKTEQAYEDLKSAQESLIQAEKLASLGGLVAGVAHEINTPVGIALTSASVLHDATTQLRKSMTDGAVRKSEIMSFMDTAEEASRLIMSNAERAALLIHSFKQVAADQTSEIRREYELREYIDEVMSSLHQKLKHSHAQVVVVCPETIMLDGYPGAMAQILTNLTMNALTHAFAGRESGKIEINAMQSGTMVSMRFQDDGLGIPVEHVGKVFDPFFTTRRGQGGTGLGLNIVHNIITKQFGGTITVVSEPGQGVCFLLQFPCTSP